VNARDLSRWQFVQEFQFGMNWSAYSRFVGDVFGAPLAVEALLAFSLESTFVGRWVFGWDKLPPKLPAVLFRFADLSAGTVTLNGRDLAAYDPDQVHAVIGGCPQDPHIFDAHLEPDNARALSAPGEHEPGSALAGGRAGRRTP
jgi:hypothetical protein